ncbi:ATP-binding protein [Luteitalea pratensis]|uniref:ATP-binding protein n=1 Tax=Luteitalea pratensis TaxID=1855912 RepID=UPI0012FFC171|nr:ATP-binding protein [Luteitalea pratensis]
MLLQQVLVNLVMNALDAMVETPQARRKLTVRLEGRDTEVDISVHDTGFGLPTDAQLFARFVTTKSHGLESVSSSICTKALSLPATVPRVAPRSRLRCPAARPARIVRLAA